MSEYDNLRRMQKKREILGNFGFFSPKRPLILGRDTPLSKLLCIFKENRV